jgi:hypothetical protein
VKTAAIALCVVSVAALVAALRDTVVGTANARRGWALRAIAVLAFVVAVVLNLAAG